MVYLYGASGHAKVVIEIAENLGLEVGGLVDADPAIKTLLDYPVADRFESEKSNWIVSIGNNKIRKRIAKASIDKDYCTLVHLNTSVSKRTGLGRGTVVMAGVSINSGVQIGEHCILNTNASIDHDCVIHDFVHISPNVALAGDVTVGEGTHIGIGACVIQGVKIGSWCTIGAGAVIIKDVPDGVTVVGNPGRIIK